MEAIIVDPSENQAYKLSKGPFPMRMRFPAEALGVGDTLINVIQPDAKKYKKALKNKKGVTVTILSLQQGGGSFWSKVKDFGKKALAGVKKGIDTVATIVPKEIRDIAKDTISSKADALIPGLGQAANSAMTMAGLGVGDGIAPIGSGIAPIGSGQDGGAAKPKKSPEEVNAARVANLEKARAAKAAKKSQ